LIKDLDQGKSHFYEKGLQKYLDHLVGRNLRFTNDIKKAKASIYIITVGTPIIKGTKKPNLEYALKATRDIAQILEPSDLVVFRSTLPLGFCRKNALPLLEKVSGLKAGQDFYLAYAPERTTEGEALKELRSNPQIVGGFDEKSKDIAGRLFNSLTHSVIDVETLEAAEMCKLIDNSFRDHMFAFSNQMAPLAESFNLDLCKIVDAVNHGYKRNSVPKPSPGVGGACLSKDPYILNMAFEEHQLDSALVLHSRRVNEAGPKILRDKLARLLKKVGKDLRDSTSLWFLEHLPNHKNIYAYDPIVKPEDIKKLGIKPVSLEQGFRNADAVVFLNNHQSYHNIDIFHYTSLMKKPAVFIDTWHLFEPLDVKSIDGIVYGGIGV
jgi:UDP-N-acetyl-D-mannosaminuronic acid dehydrogenase